MKSLAYCLGWNACNRGDHVITNSFVGKDSIDYYDWLYGWQDCQKAWDNNILNPKNIYP
jgi:hypothetical protein